MSNILEYKGYHTKIIYEKEDQCLRGVIEGISDFVNFEGDIASIEEEFHKAVDEYLDFCKSVLKRM